jgi:hypothetical protein
VRAAAAQAEGTRGDDQASRWKRGRQVPSRLLRSLFNLFFAQSKIQKEIDRVAIQATTTTTYVRVVRQSGDDVVGLVDEHGAGATLSYLGQGLSLTACWAPDDQGAWHRLPGTHIPTRGIVEIDRWDEEKTRPEWLRAVPVPALTGNNVAGTYS